LADAKPGESENQATPPPLAGAILELQTALPQEPTDFTLPGRRRSLGEVASR